MSLLTLEKLKLIYLCFFNLYSLVLSICIKLKRNIYNSVNLSNGLLSLSKEHSDFP